MQVVERLKTERRKKRSKWVREWLRYRSLHGEYNQLNEYLRSTKKKKKNAPINRRCTDLHCRRARRFLSCYSVSFEVQHVCKVAATCQYTYGAALQLIFIIALQHVHFRLNRLHIVLN